MDKHWHETEHHFFERAADHSFDDITVGVDEGVDLALEFTRGRTIWEKGHSVDTQLSVFYIEITAQNIIDILKGNSLRVGSIAFGDEEPDGDPEARLHSGNWKLLDDGDFTVYTRNGAAFWIDTQTDGGGNILLKAGESLLLKGHDAIEIGEEGTNAPVSVLSSNFRLVDSGEGVAIESYGPAGINLDATEGNGAVNIDSRTGTTIDGTLIPRNTTLATTTDLQHISLETIVGSDLAASIKLVATLFERDANGDVRVRNNAGLYSNSFISAGGVSDEDRSAPVHLLEPAAGTQPDNFIFPDYSSATDRFALSAALGYQLDSRTAALEERFVVGTEEEIATMTKVPGKFYCTYEDE